MDTQELPGRKPPLAPNTLQTPSIAPDTLQPTFSLQARKRNLCQQRSEPKAKAVKQYSAMVVVLAGLEVSQMKKTHLRTVSEQMAIKVPAHAKQHAAYGDGVNSEQVLRDLSAVCGKPGEARFNGVQLWKRFLAINQFIVNVFTPMFLSFLDTHMNIPSGRDLESILEDVRTKCFLLGLGKSAPSSIEQQDDTDVRETGENQNLSDESITAMENNIDMEGGNQTSEWLHVDERPEVPSDYQPQYWLVFKKLGMPAGYVPTVLRINLEEVARPFLMLNMDADAAISMHPNCEAPGDLSRKRQRQLERSEQRTTSPQSSVGKHGKKNTRSFREQQDNEESMIEAIID
jgi:hypothetical protein